MCVYVRMYMCALVQVCVHVYVCTWTCVCMPVSVLKIGVGWKMMTWQLKVLVAPPSTHMVAYNYLARQWWHMPPLGHLGGRGRCISEIETSLVYRVSSRTARAT